MMCLPEQRTRKLQESEGRSNAILDIAIVLGYRLFCASTSTEHPPFSNKEEC
jgi:hypothetical protein